MDILIKKLVDHKNNNTAPLTEKEFSYIQDCFTSEFGRAQLANSLNKFRASVLFFVIGIKSSRLVSAILPSINYGNY